MTVRLALLILFSSLAGACSTMQHAQQIGGAESATWVFVNQTGGGAKNGIYRCSLDDDARPHCIKATVHR